MQRMKTEALVLGELLHVTAAHAHMRVLASTSPREELAARRFQATRLAILQGRLAFQAELSLIRDAISAVVTLAVHAD